VHTYPGQYRAIYGPLLGETSFEGPSLQMGGGIERAHEESLRWVKESGKAGRPWFVCVDEVGPANEGVAPDGANGARRAEIFHQVVWGNLLAGGSGWEWYFGYKHAHNDLNLEDFRSRDSWWRETSAALELFRKKVPFAEMEPADDLVEGKNAWCLAKPGEFYALYTFKQPRARLRLEAGTYDVCWYNAKTGWGGLVKEESIRAAGTTEIELPTDPGGGLLITLKRDQ
jgi:hypothetical protein